MRLIRGHHHHFSAGCAITIGAFESLHRGHQAIIQQTRALAQSADIPSAVVTFEPMPSEFFNTQPARRIYRFSQRLRILESLDLDYLICLRFCQSLADMSAEEFVTQILINSLNVKYIVIGQDFCFGKNRTGNFDMLKQYGEQLGFVVQQIDMETIDDEWVSSTRIREALMNGDFSFAKRLLGRSFEASGVVVKGDGRGQTIGFATANICCAKYTPPLQGVFTADVSMDGVSYPAVVNAGVRPTVDGKKYQLEAHLLDFNQTIYGRKLHIKPLAKLRDEKRFESVEMLKQAIAADIEKAKQFFEQRKKDE